MMTYPTCTTNASGSVQWESEYVVMRAPTAMVHMKPMLKRAEITATEPANCRILSLSMKSASRMSSRLVGISRVSMILGTHPMLKSGFTSW